MNIHRNARTTPHSRAEIARRVILEGQAPGAVAVAFGVCVKAVGKWVTRFKAGGLEALADRSSRPHRLHKSTPQAVRESVIDLRSLRRPGCEIARETGVSVSTVSRILRTARLSRATRNTAKTSAANISSAWLFVASSGTPAADYTSAT